MQTYLFDDVHIEQQRNFVHQWSVPDVKPNCLRNSIECSMNAIVKTIRRWHILRRHSYWTQRPGWHHMRWPKFQIIRNRRTSIRSKTDKKVLIMILLHLNYGSFTLRKHHPRFSLRMTEYLDATIASCLKTDQFKVIQDLDLLSFGTTIWIILDRQNCIIFHSQFHWSYKIATAPSHWAKFRYDSDPSH